MSRGHGELQRFVLECVEVHPTWTISELSIAAWPDDRYPHGSRPPLKTRVESMRRAVDALAVEGLVRLTWSTNWDPRRWSPVGYVSESGKPQRIVCPPFTTVEHDPLLAAEREWIERKRLRRTGRKGPPTPHLAGGQ